jgi:hypothetical protein
MNLRVYAYANIISNCLHLYHAFPICIRAVIVDIKDSYYLLLSYSVSNESFECILVFWALFEFLL